MALQEQVPTIDAAAAAETLEAFARRGLLTTPEVEEVLALFSPGFPLADTIRAAESVHVHVKVADVDDLPHDEIVASGVEPTSCTEGYVKYPFPGGVNMIFSSIPISEDDMLDGTDVAMPVLDHKGIDLRDESDDVRAVFDAVPGLAGAKGWRHVGQGGGGQPVYCCHTEVTEKHWVYPEPDDAGQRRPIEIAFGELVLHDAKMGCDLRPIDPAHPRAAEARAALSSCAAGHATADGPGGTSYYERADLGRFTEVGRYAGAHMDRFWAYYNGVFQQDGALDRREKALIGLAVASTQRCPYCIDAFTNSCLDTGATVEQMHEALHAAASLAAGIHLVHGVQLQNALRQRSAIE